MNLSISFLSLAHGLVIGASLTLALTHLALSLRTRLSQERIAYVASATMAVSAATATYFELSKSLADDLDTYLAALCGDIVAVFLMVLSLSVFIRWYFRVRNDALFIAAVAFWTVGNAYILALYPDGLYAEITGLRFFETSWGETYAKIDATLSGAKYVSDVGTVLVLVYIALAARDAWKRNARQRAVVVGGASIGFLLIAGVLVPLDDAGIVPITMPLGLPFLGIVAALTYQMINDRARAAMLRVEVEKLRRTSLAGEIAAGLVHELSQPLTSILSNAQAARRILNADEPDLPEVRDALEDVVSEDKRAASILSGLRGFLQDRPVERVVVDVNAPIRRVSNMLAADVRRKDAALELALHREPIRISAGEVQVEQVIMNLSLNALRALSDVPPGKRRLRISSSRDDEVAEIRVADSGPGIDPKLTSSLFNPFTSGKDGLGMGLAICRRIVEAHGGLIVARQSDLGGAEFVISLPLARHVSGS